MIQSQDPIAKFLFDVYDQIDAPACEQLHLLGEQEASSAALSGLIDRIEPKGYICDSLGPRPHTVYRLLDIDFSRRIS